MNTKSLLTALAAFPVMASAQSILYPEHFDLSEVTLHESPFKKAMEINDRLLLDYDADRLMTPFIRQAGLETVEGGKYFKWSEKHPSFLNWGLSDWSLEGHAGGHYLSALALGYAASHDADMKAKLKERLDYCLGIIKDCQDAYKNNTEGLKGFVGGQPLNNIWTELYAGRTDAFDGRGWWVPLYCEHKVIAGLRDAYVYTGNELAKEMYRGIADWSVELFANLTDEQCEHILRWEHGGMNEAVADAYKIFGDEKYLKAAMRYSHLHEINGMQGEEGKYNNAFLDGQHANTQVPKFIGFERINQLKSTEEYAIAARNFWDDVAEHRTVCIGGNSIDEHFLAAADASRYISNLNGPESCNSNNMLKLSELMFDDTHNAKYVDFYESTMINHILSTQDPKTGGYVYFTSLRPQSYRIYSTVNESMWCCVGTGMENHSKYGHFVYTHSADNKTLYVNLFTASELSNKTFGIKQETEFPFCQKTKLTVEKSGKYTIALRHPAWAGEGYAVSINGKKEDIEASKGTASYVSITRKWKAGDVIEVALPMEMRIEECPNLENYIAFKYGPILLGSRVTLKDEVLPNEYGNEGRMDHAPGSRATSKEITTSPMLICNRGEVMGRIKEKDLSKLEFTIDVRCEQSKGKWEELTLEPFYAIHHDRYMCYWYQQTAEEYAKSDFAIAEKKAAALIARTVDYVGTGEQQSEAGHEALYSAGSTIGSFNGEFYRDANPNGYIQYVLGNPNKISKGLSVACRFTSFDRGRHSVILIDGQKIADIDVTSDVEGKDDKGFFDVETVIPEELLLNADGSVKSSLTFRIESTETKIPGIYVVRLLTPEK